MGPALLVLAALSHVLGPLGQGGLAESVRFAVAGVAGVGVLLAVPGVALLPMWCRLLKLGPSPGWFHLVVGACLASVAGHAVGHAGVILLGMQATFWPMWGAAAGLLVLAELAASRLGVGLEPPPRSGLVMGALAGAGVLLIFTIVSSPPRFIDLRGYWSEELYTQVANLNPGPGAVAPTMVIGSGWRLAGTSRTYELTGSSGTLVVDASESTSQRHCLVLQNLGQADLALEVSVSGGRRLSRTELISPVEMDFPRPREASDPALLVLPALYNPSRQGRNSPPPLRLLVPARVQGELRFNFKPLAGDGPVKVRLHDFTGLSALALRGALDDRFFVGDTGDIYETLELSRGFREHVLQHSSSYGGDMHDGGGPTSISDEPPGHHFLAFLALTFVQDGVAGVSALHLAYLMLLWLLAVHLSAVGNPRLASWHLLPLLVVALIYTRLCRLGLESNAPDTLFLLLMLAAVGALLQGRRWFASGLVAVAFWVHVPAPHTTVLLGLAALALPRRRDAVIFTIQTLGLLALVLLARYLAIAVAAGWDTAWYTGQAEFLAGNRSGMFKQILLAGRWELAPLLAGVAGQWALLLLVGSAAAAPLFVGSLAARAQKDQGAWVLFLFGILFFAATALLDLHRPHHVGPVVFPLAAALTRRLSMLDSDKTRRILWAISLAAALAALAFFLFFSGPDPTDTLNPVHLGDFAHVPLNP